MLSEDVQAVLRGDKRWACIQGDCLDVMAQLPAESIALTFGSPPYTQARLYLEDGQDLGIARDAEAWAAWMVEVYRSALRVCVGLTAFVVEGQTKNYRYDCAPALLMADLHRSGVKLRKPPIYRRVGIPGSGGPDWLRNDWEWIISAARGGKLPWSDNTACGHPPKWGAGGAMTNRMKNGKRVFKRVWKDLGKGGHLEQDYTLPDIANPGNVIDTKLSFARLVNIILHYANATQSRPDQVLRDLRQAINSSSLPRWLFGIHTSVLGAEILRSEMYGVGLPRTFSNCLPWLPSDISSKACQAPVLQSEVLRGSPCSEVARSAGKRDRALSGKAEDDSEGLLGVRADDPVARSSSGRKPDQQCAGKSTSSLSDLSRQEAQETACRLPDMWSEGEAVQGLWSALRQTLSAIQEIWRSAPFEAHRRALLPTVESPGIIDCNVGGGKMGNGLAHENEAPFPEDLARFFVKSFAPPDSIVLDPFAGSGTTLSVAVQEGRRAIGIDLRRSQVDLTARRLSGVTPGLFNTLEK